MPRVLNAARHKARAVLSTVRGKVRAFPPRVFLYAGVVSFIGAAGVLFASQPWQRHDLDELERRAELEPRDADLQRHLGEARFAAGKRLLGVRAYDKALGLDAGVADDTLIADLVSCYGHREQGAAHTVIVKHELTDAAEPLSSLVRHKTWRVRTGAMATLEKLGKASRQDYLEVWLADLGSSDCDIRRYAIDKLGELGDRRALAAIRSAKKKDAEVSWYESRCLGDDRVEEAEARILARR